MAAAPSATTAASQCATHGSPSASASMAASCQSAPSLLQQCGVDHSLAQDAGGLLLGVAAAAAAGGGLPLLLLMPGDNECGHEAAALDGFEAHMQLCSGSPLFPRDAGEERAAAPLQLCTGSLLLHDDDQLFALAPPAAAALPLSPSASDAAAAGAGGGGWAVGRDDGAAAGDLLPGSPMASSLLGSGSSEQHGSGATNFFFCAAAAASGVDAGSVVTSSGDGSLRSITRSASSTRRKLRAITSRRSFGPAASPYWGQGVPAVGCPVATHQQQQLQQAGLGLVAPAGGGMLGTPCWHQPQHQPVAPGCCPSASFCCYPNNSPSQPGAAQCWSSSSVSNSPWWMPPLPGPPGCVWGLPLFNATTAPGIALAPAQQQQQRFQQL